jgi:hypothetical protein
VSEFGSFFVASPEAFPGAVEGEPWGEHRRVLDLPGGPFSITGLSAAQVELMDREYSTVMAGELPGNGVVHETRTLRAEYDFFREIDIDGWEYTIDLDSSPDLLRMASLNLAGLVPWGEGAAAGLWTPVEDSWFQGVIENYLRVVVAHRLILREGVLLHSSGVVIDGSAYLFVGESGAGKSTLAKKAMEAGAQVLSDDLNAVVDLSGNPAVAQLPFTGELRKQSICEGTAPLRAIFLLNKSEEVACREISLAEATAALVSTAPFINFGARNLDTLVGVAAALTDRVPVARLTSAVGSPFEEIKRAVLGFLG